MITPSYRIIGMTLLLALTLSGCDFIFGKTASPVSQKISKQIKQDGVKEINLAAMTEFPWDALYIYTPYTDRKDICTELQLETEACTRIAPEEFLEKNQYLMVFRNKESIVHVENSAFRILSRLPHPIHQHEARFTVRKYKEQYELEQVSPDSSNKPH